MKVLLADDSPLILERFVKMVDWGEFGYDTVLTAVDGKAAWQEYEKHHPELVITDIQMPRMTGLDLTRKIREESQDTVILFLSSYEEFSYAKAALELKVSDYLLKHETKKETLEQKLTEVGRMLEKQRLNARYTAQAALRELLREMESNAPEEEMENYSLSLPGKYDLLFLEQDHIYPVMEKASGLTVVPAAQKDLSDQLESSAEHVRTVLQVQPCEYLVLLDSSGNVRERAFCIKSGLEKKYPATFSVIILAADQTITACGTAYIANRRLFEQKYFYPRSSVIHADCLQRNGKQGPPLKLSLAENLLKSGQWEQLASLIDESYIRLIEAKDQTRLAEVTSGFVSLLLRYDRRAADVGTGRSFQAAAASDAACWYDAESIHQWMQRKFAELAQFWGKPGTCGYSKIVSDAIAYINQHYDNCDLGLDEVAGQLRISESRLNTVFKKETGETVWKFIIKVRMEKACELLDQGNEKVTEVCRKSGYRNISYFSKVFKDTYGLTPMEYRRKQGYEN